VYVCDGVLAVCGGVPAVCVCVCVCVCDGVAKRIPRMYLMHFIWKLSRRRSWRTRRAQLSEP